MVPLKEFLIPVPVNEFKGIDPNLISIGSLAVDKRNNVVWISLLAFNTKGQILRYNIENKTFDTSITYLTYRLVRSIISSFLYQYGKINSS